MKDDSNKEEGKMCRRDCRDSDDERKYSFILFIFP